MPNRKVLAVLGAAQFLMVLDQAVMNVAISQLVADFDTTVTTIQAVIALYALTMAALMLTGGKVGDIIGRRRAFIIGICIYATGSALTGASWSVPSLTLGWSILEGIGAALVLPALVALTAGNFQGSDRAIALACSAASPALALRSAQSSGAGVRTTDFTWRLVFLGEVVVAAGILLGTRWIAEPTRRPRSPARLGRRRSFGLGPGAGGDRHPRGEHMGLAAAAQLRSSRSACRCPCGRGRGAVLAGFRAWERRARKGLDPLVHFRLFSIQSLRGGVAMLLSQNLILMGIFFTIPCSSRAVLDADARPGQSLPASAGLLSTLAGWCFQALL